MACSTGVWWGLRSSADGKAAGFPVAVFGGDHADIPVSDHAGERLGALLAERTLSAIVDVSEFSNAGRARFVGDLLMNRAIQRAKYEARNA